MSATTSGDLAAIPAGESLNSAEVLTEKGASTLDAANSAFQAAMQGVDGDTLVAAVEENAAEGEAARDGQPRGPDGKFVKVDEALVPEGTAPEGTTEPDAEAPAETAEPEAPAPETITFTDRNGNEVTVEVSDPDIAEVLKATKNDGMRKQEFHRRIEAVQTKEQEFRAFEIMLQTTPETVVDHMSPDVKLRTLQYLLASNFDDVAPLIAQWYGDKGTAEYITRKEALLGMKEHLSASQLAGQAQLAESVRRDKIGREIDALIPETASPEDSQDFFTAAAAHLGAVESQRGHALTPSEVAPLLERFRTRFGFSSPAAPAVAAPPSLIPVVAAPAVPVGDKAVAFAKKAAATAQRMKALPALQAAAAKVAPQSAGAAPAVVPRPTSIEDAGRNFMAAIR